MTTILTGDGLALLQAVCENPGCDTARLVFADWFDENGQGDKAEFIRLQIELAKPWSEDTGECWQCRCGRVGGQHTNGPCRCSADFRAKRKREKNFLANYVQKEFITVTRGFVSGIKCSSFEWLKIAPDIAWHPLQTIRCGFCHGSGMARYDEEWGCPDCGGKGHMPGTGKHPRPCPPTAQPLISVTLVSITGRDIEKFCELARERHSHHFTASDTLKDILALEWPWIEFTLPSD